MPLIDVAGVGINFPFEPYACQLDYMKSVVRSLREGQNAILESPTGTGKTLCLLCSSLAWLEEKKAQIESQRWKLANSAENGEELFNTNKLELAGKLDQAAGAWSGELAAPKIIYASRTHSQLTQAVQELKRTAYSHFKVCVLGSREQMCIHPQVMKEESNMIKVHLCRSKVSTRTCHFFNSVENSKHNFTNQIMDIEDLVIMGKKMNCCPYYVSRELKSEADVIFLPYNYLLDPKSRKAHGVELQGNIVIFDEAHNLEKICEESASFDFSSSDITSAIRESDVVISKLKDLGSDDGGFSAFGGMTDAANPSDFELEDVLKIKMMLINLERIIDELTLNSKDGLTKPGSFIFELFEKTLLTYETKTQVIDLLDKLVTFLSTEGGSSAFNSRGNSLSKFADIVKIVFSHEPSSEYTNMSAHQQNASRAYRVHIRENPPDTQKNKLSGWGNSAKSSKPGRTLSYWCFSPGHTMQDMKSRGVRSIILTSGTLSPLSSFKSEMGVDFHIQLENPHVIDSKQVWVGTLSRGPDSVLLCSDYQTRFREDYQKSLGNVIVNFARIVPNGLLLFFPSYPVMDKCLSNWQDNGLWSRIEQWKPVYVEPRNKREFVTTMEAYYTRVNDPTTNGATFAAVCRGKVSEGLDFADNNGRAVIITGLPYPPRMDPKVILKMKFLDESRACSGKGLSGNEWYSQQATRAVNQAIGRVIRHKDDFGAILLCDKRFAEDRAVSQLPSWVRPHCTRYDKFGLAMRDMIAFFKNAAATMPQPKPPKHKSASSCHGAHFQPSFSSNYGGLKVSDLKKSSAVISDVPSLKKPKLADDAKFLSDLGAQYSSKMKFPSSSLHKGQGLLSALTVSEVRGNLFDTEGAKKLRQKEDLGVSSSQKSDADLKTKRKILIKGTKCSADVTRQGLQTAEQYLSHVKKTLSEESYKSFSQALKSYKLSEDYDALVTVLADLFTDDPAKHHLFRAFQRFLRSKHKAQFHELCISLTGEGCAVTMVDCSSAKRKIGLENEMASGKKIKSSANGDPMDTKSTDKVTAISCGVNAGASNVIASKYKAAAPLTAILPVINTKNESASENSVAKGASNCLNSCDGAMTDCCDNAKANCSGDDTPSGDTWDVANFEHLLKQKSGYSCCSCREDALAPMKALCGHIACLKCWKRIIPETHACPECGVKTRRRQLRQLFFPSGPGLPGN